MKKLSFCVYMLAVACSLHAQTTVDDFENSPKTWNTVSCGNEIVDNPHQEGLNLSCKCLQIVRAPECDNWSGAIYTLPEALTGYKYVHALMYRNNTHNPNLKVTDNGENLDMVPMNAIVANEWQDVVFDISGKAQADYLMFMVDRDDITENAVLLIDDVIFSNDATPRTTPNAQCADEAEPEQGGEYTLVWNEDFTDGALDTKVWNIEVNGDGGGNNELQYYCEKGVSLGAEPTTGKKCLILTATKESYGGKYCTSGRVNSKHNLYYTYGKIEARVKLPNTANGLWPAFWQLGENIDEVGWPRCGETDIIEMGHKDGFNGRQDRYFNGAMHVGSAWNTVLSDAQASEWSYSLQDTFHILTMIWTPTSVDMYMDKDAHPENAAYFHAKLEPNDDENYNRQLVFGKPNFIIANLAVGGNFPGIYNIDGITALAAGPRSMYIDWIRIYQKGEATETFVCPSTSDPIEPENAAAIENNTIRPTATKVLHNGTIQIIRNNQTYTITGQRIE